MIQNHFAIQPIQMSDGNIVIVPHAVKLKMEIHVKDGMQDRPILPTINRIIAITTIVPILMAIQNRGVIQPIQISDGRTVIRNVKSKKLIIPAASDVKHSK